MNETLALRARAPSFCDALRIQLRVIGALILRELHTRYGRDNIGYLWMVGEPMMLATVIGVLHAAAGHSQFGSDIKPLPFAVLGYTVFIVFRGLVNRSEGALEANGPLLYHRSVTILDIVISRSLLELAGTFITYAVLMSLIIGMGFAQLPERPLYLLAAWALIFWYGIGQAMIIMMGTYESRTLGRLVHTYSYFMVGLSGAFYQMIWLPHPFREWVQWIPLTSVFELARYGQFQSANLDYFHGQYLVGACLIQTWMGLVMIKIMRHRIHLV